MPADRLFEREQESGEALRQRIVTGTAGALVFAAALLAGGWPYRALLLLLAVVGYYEYVRLNGMRLLDPLVAAGFAGMLAIAVPWGDLGAPIPPASAVVWCLMLALLAVTVFTKNRANLDGAALLFLGAVYIGFGFSEMIVVRGLEQHGLYLSALAFGCIWASDIGAYFVGRAFGKTKLWPAISPNKTVEGAVGGILLALLVGLLFAVLSPNWISAGRGLLIGLTASVAGQLGDLVQSAYKRHRGVKDTGNLLPGHGGVLDRCDSWLIVFPLLTMTGLLP